MCRIRPGLVLRYRMQPAGARPSAPPNPPPPIRAGGVINQGLLDYCAMHNYISLAMATPPSGLGSHWKHVGVPDRLRIRNRYEASAGWRPYRGREGAKMHNDQKCRISVRMQKRKTNVFEKCGGKVTQMRRMHCAIGAEFPADAMGPGAHGKG